MDYVIYAFYADRRIFMHFIQFYSNNFIHLYFYAFYSHFIQRFYSFYSERYCLILCILCIRGRYKYNLSSVTEDVCKICLSLIKLMIEFMIKF